MRDLREQSCEDCDDAINQYSSQSVEGRLTRSNVLLNEIVRIKEIRDSLWYGPSPIPVVEDTRRSDQDGRVDEDCEAEERSNNIDGCVVDVGPDSREGRSRFGRRGDVGLLLAWSRVSPESRDERAGVDRLREVEHRSALDDWVLGIEVVGLVDFAVLVGMQSAHCRHLGPDEEGMRHSRRSEDTEGEYG